MSQVRLLVVEDDADLRRLLREGLSREGFDVAVASNGRDAVAAATADPPALLVIDIGLPDADGRDVCQALRGRGVNSPVLFLTAKDAVSDRVSGFSAGGDDYLTKPFAFAELVVRLRALERRSGSQGEPREKGAGLLLDPAAHSVGVGGESVALTPTEYRILGAITSRPGEALRRRELVAAAWPEGAVVHDNTLDVYVGRLRRKLATLPGSAAIRTVHGVGYALEES